MLKLTGIPVGDHELASLEETKDIAGHELPLPLLLLRLVALCNSKGEPPRLGSKESMTFWAHMGYYASRQFTQSLALYNKTESEKGK